MIDPPSLDRVRYVAKAIGDLRDDVVFVGGAIVGLLITDKGAYPPRTTIDVDVVVGIHGRMEFYELDRRLLQLGFVIVINGPTCRYLHGQVVVDFYARRCRSTGIKQPMVPSRPTNLRSLRLRRWTSYSDHLAGLFHRYKA